MCLNYFSYLRFLQILTYSRESGRQEWGPPCTHPSDNSRWVLFWIPKSLLPAQDCVPTRLESGWWDRRSHSLFVEGSCHSKQRISDSHTLSAKCFLVHLFPPFAPKYIFNPCQYRILYGWSFLYFYISSIENRCPRFWGSPTDVDVYRGLGGMYQGYKKDEYVRILCQINCLIRVILYSLLIIILFC